MQGDARRRRPRHSNRCRTWPHRCAWHFPASPGTPAAARPASELMTFSTSEVAVCCSSVSRSSLSSRVFSMAMTACAAKLVHQLDLLVGERPHFLAVDGDGADQLAVLQHRHATGVRAPPSSTAATRQGIALEVGLLVTHIGNMTTLRVRPHDVCDVRMGPEHGSARPCDIPEGCWYAMKSRGAEGAVLVREQNAESGLADPRRVSSMA